jgi:hypothetical protein
MQTGKRHKVLAVLSAVRQEPLIRNGDFPQGISAKKPKIIGIVLVAPMEGNRAESWAEQDNRHKNYLTATVCAIRCNHSICG